MALNFRVADRLRQVFSGAKCMGQFRSLASLAEAAETRYYDVPAGHQKSDLSSSVCHIGLGRLRDLTMRQDLHLMSTTGAHSLADVFKGKQVVIFGLPDMGKVCSEKQVPSFRDALPALRKLGIQKVYCVTVCSPEDAFSWAESVGINGVELDSLVDDTGAFTRALGLELNGPQEAGPRSQRYAAFIVDGVLKRLKVEKNPADLNVSSGPAMVEVVESFTK